MPRNLLMGIIILLPALPVFAIDADFTSDRQIGDNPMTVQFLDRSAGGIPSRWEWDFGDGGTSNLANPVHGYALPGCYTVSLTVHEGAFNEDTETKVRFIYVFPVPEFTATPPVGQSPLHVQFNNTTVTSPTAQYHWSFGDGGVSTERSPSHVYTTPGTYAAILMVIDCLPKQTYQLISVRRPPLQYVLEQ